MVKKAKDLLGVNLRRLRENLNWTQSDLAEAAELSLKMVQKIEYGKTNPSTKTLDTLARALKSGVSELFQSDQPKPGVAPIDGDLLADASKILLALSKKGPATRLGVLYMLTRDEEYADRLREMAGAGPIVQGIQTLSKAMK